MDPEQEASASPANADEPRLVTTETNSFGELFMYSIYGGLVTGFAAVIFQHYSLPPTDGAYGGPIFPPLAFPVMLAFSGIGGVIAFSISLPFLRRVHLEHSFFLVCGVTVVTMGALFPFVGPAGILVPFIAMPGAMLYCRLRLSKRPSGIGMTDAPQRSPKFPTRVFWAIKASLVVVVLAYVVRAAWPDYDLDLFRAARSGDIEDAREALNAGADPNYVGQSFMTPLYLATACGHEHIVHLLAERAATIDLSHRDTTPLMVAAEKGNKKLVRYLLDQGADPTLEDGEGKTALHLARTEGHAGIAKLLAVGSSD